MPRISIIDEAPAVAGPRRAALRLRLDPDREVLDGLVLHPRKLGGPELAQAASRRLQGLVEVGRPVQEVDGGCGRRRTAVIVVIPDGSNDDDGDRHQQQHDRQPCQRQHAGARAAGRARRGASDLALRRAKAQNIPYSRALPEARHTYR